MTSQPKELSHRLVAGEFSTEQSVAETFDIARSACGETYRGRQEWRMQVSEVEIVYDDAGIPIHAIKRSSMPGAGQTAGLAGMPHGAPVGETRTYELRGANVVIEARPAGGLPSFERLLPGGRLPVEAGAKPSVVLAPGRGVVSMWLRRAHLRVGEESRDLVLDIRPALESLEVGVLRREPDQFDRALNRNVRVYTFFGQETVLADETDTVIGDLAGLRADSSTLSRATPTSQTAPAGR